jgi:hypothetical protein
MAFSKSLLVATITRTSEVIRSPPAFELPVLQIGGRLGGRSHVADLIQEEGPPVALFEFPHAPRQGSGEGSLLVAEELALEQGLGDGGAIHRQERLIPAPAVVVDRPGHHLFPGAALPPQEDGHFGGRHLADHLVDLLHGRGGPHQGLFRLPGFFPVRQRHHLLHHPGDFQGPLYQSPHLGNVEGFEDIIEGPELHGLNRRLRSPEGRHQDHQGLGIPLLDLSEDLQAALPGHFDIHDHQVRVILGEPFQSFDSVLGQRDSQPLPFQHAVQGIAHARVIVDD